MRTKHSNTNSNLNSVRSLLFIVLRKLHYSLVLYPLTKNSDVYHILGNTFHNLKLKQRITFFIYTRTWVQSSTKTSFKMSLMEYGKKLWQPWKVRKSFSFKQIGETVLKTLIIIAYPSTCRYVVFTRTCQLSSRRLFWKDFLKKKCFPSFSYAGFKHLSCDR